MARTSVNVIGNCLATCVIGKREGEFWQEVVLVASVEPMEASQKPPIVLEQVEKI